MLNKITRLFSRGKIATDPVCGMRVDTRRPGGGTFVYLGQTYYFCGNGCRLEFQQDPQGYLSGAKKMEM